jgi:hypothetical protein
VDLNDDVVDRCLRLGPLDQPHPGRPRGLIRHDDRLHENFSSVLCLLVEISQHWEVHAGNPLTTLRNVRPACIWRHAMTLRLSHRGATFSNASRV